MAGEPMGREHTTNATTQPEGGAVGLSPAKQPPLAPNKITALPATVPNPAASQANGSEGNDAWSAAPITALGSTGSGSAQTKLSGMKRAEVLSLLYKHGVGLDKRGGATMQAKRRVVNTTTKEGQLLVKLASMAGPSGVKRLVKKGDSPRVAMRKVAAVIKLRAAFKQMGLI